MRRRGWAGSLINAIYNNLCEVIATDVSTWRLNNSWGCAGKTFLERLPVYSVRYQAPSLSVCDPGTFSLHPKNLLKPVC